MNVSADTRVVTWDELSKHTEKSSLWVLIEGRVFDVTTYLAEHPGGDDILIKYSGLDATERFNQENHTDYARSLRDARLVGKIESNPKPDGYDQRVKKQKPKTGTVDPNREHTWTEIERHSRKEDLWIVVEGGVYDVTDFQDEHPGGASILVKYAGKDGTQRFNEVRHSQGAIKQMPQYKVGLVRQPHPSQAGGSVNKKIIMFLLGLLVAYVYHTFIK